MEPRITKPNEKWRYLFKDIGKRTRLSCVARDPRKTVGCDTGRRLQRNDCDCDRPMGRLAASCEKLPDFRDNVHIGRGRSYQAGDRFCFFSSFSVRAFFRVDVVWRVTCDVRRTSPDGHGRSRDRGRRVPATGLSGRRTVQDAALSPRAGRPGWKSRVEKRRRGQSGIYMIRSCRENRQSTDSARRSTANDVNRAAIYRVVFFFNIVFVREYINIPSILCVRVIDDQTKLPTWKHTWVVCILFKHTRSSRVRIA